MALKTLATAVAFVVAIFANLPAHAAWDVRVVHEAGFAVNMPTEPKVVQGEYRTGLLGRVPASIYSSADRGVNFSVTVVDVSKNLMESASILQETIYIRTRDLNIITDSLSRSEPGRAAVYGRRITEDTAEGGRRVSALYLTKGKLYIFEVNIPAGGDKGTPMSGRFIDSVEFNVDRDRETAGAPSAPAP